jgi:hypothetical protein
MKPLEKFSLLQDLDHLLMENPALQRDLSGNQVKNGFARYQVGGIGGALVNKTLLFQL